MKVYTVHKVNGDDPSVLEKFLNSLKGEVPFILPIVEGSSTHGVGGYIGTNAFLVIEKRDL